MLKAVRDEAAAQRVFEGAIRKFGETIARDASLQAKLSAGIDSGMSRDQWIDLFVALGVEHRLMFTSDQLRIALQEQKQGKDKILPSMVQKWIALL